MARGRRWPVCSYGLLCSRKIPLRLEGAGVMGSRLRLVSCVSRSCHDCISWEYTFRWLGTHSVFDHRNRARYHLYILAVPGRIECSRHTSARISNTCNDLGVRGCGNVLAASLALASSSDSAVTYAWHLCTRLPCRGDPRLRYDCHPGFRCSTGRCRGWAAVLVLGRELEEDSTMMICTRVSRC